MSLSQHSVSALLGATELTVTGGRVTIDESWSPYIQARLTLIDVDATTYEDLDPRVTPNPAVTITLESTFGAWNAFSRDDTEFTAELQVRARTRDSRTGEVTITLESDEARAQDYKQLDPAGGIDFFPAPWDLLVNDLLDSIGKTLTSYPDDLDAYSPGWYWETGQSLWDAPEAALQQAGLRLYADEAGDWHLVHNPVNDEAVITLSPDPGDNITELESEITLNGSDAYADAVVVVYRWTDNLGVSQVEMDVAQEPSWSNALTIEYDNVQYPGSGAAARILARQLLLGQTKPVTAISNYDVRPGKWVAIQDTDGWAAGRCVSVVWDLENRTMRVETREITDMPETSWLLDPAGVAWQDIPVGIDWTEDL